MGTKHPHGVLPTVLARRTPRCPPSQPPRDRPPAPQNPRGFSGGAKLPPGYPATPPRPDHGTWHARIGPENYLRGAKAPGNVRAPAGGGSRRLARKSGGWIDWQECRGTAAQLTGGHGVLAMDPDHGAGELGGAGEALGGQEGSSPSFWAPAAKKLKRKSSTFEIRLDPECSLRTSLTRLHRTESRFFRSTGVSRPVFAGRPAKHWPAGTTG